MAERSRLGGRRESRRDGGRRSRSSRSTPANHGPALAHRPIDTATAVAVMDEVQRTAGNRAATQLVQRRPGRTRERRSEPPPLGAVAQVVMHLPYVLGQLSREQLQIIQRQIDAAVVNPEARARGDAHWAKSRRYEGSLLIRDPKEEALAEREYAKVIPTSLAHKRFRLDHTKLLAPDVFTPQKGDADEMAFLDALRARLDRSGIWLRIADGPTPELWLSLGPDGDHVPSLGGLVTREKLLETTALGAMYYRMIFQSPKHTTVDAELDGLESYLLGGMDEWHRQRGVRSSAAPLVVPISDWLGDAEFPSLDTWEVPWQTFMKARWAWANRELDAAHVLAVVAGLGAVSAGELLAEYARATASGAEVAVTWLERTKVAAATVFTIASIYAGGVGLVRAGAVEGGAAAGSTLGRNMATYLAENPQVARELAAIEVVAGPAGPVTNNLKKRLVGLGMGRFF